MSTGVLLEAAHGRSYQTIEQAKYDWDRFLDFRLPNGFYCDKKQAQQLLDKYDGPLYIRINGVIEELAK